MKSDKIQAEMKTRVSKVEEGVKYDYGKTRFDLIPGDSLEKLAEVYTYGTKKYDDNNWRKGMSWSRCFGAMMRHVWAFWRGESYDRESGCHHLAMGAWYCFTLMNYEKTHPEKDDRVKDLQSQAEITQKICPFEHHEFDKNGVCVGCGCSCKHDGGFTGNFCNICGAYCI